MKHLPSSVEKLREWGKKKKDAGTHGCVFNGLLPCLLAYSADYRSHISWSIELDLGQAVLVSFYHPLNLWLDTRKRWTAKTCHLLKSVTDLSHMAKSADFSINPPWRKKKKKAERRKDSSFPLSYNVLTVKRGFTKSWWKEVSSALWRFKTSFPKHPSLEKAVP